MIWGMTLEPGKLYTETMREEVQLSMAAIDSRRDIGGGATNSFCQIVMQTSKGEYVLCTLIHGVMFQQNLDLKIMPREKVTFSVEGSSVVYLVGYTASQPGDGTGCGEDGLEAGRDSSAWEASDSEESFQHDYVKVEPIDAPEDHSQSQQGVNPTVQLREEPFSRIQPLVDPSAGPMEGGYPEEQEEEITLSISDTQPADAQGVSYYQEQFIPPQGPSMQKSQAGPMRQPVVGYTVHPTNNQRNYPPQRRKQRKNRSQRPGETRSRLAPLPDNVQQAGNIGNMQQQQQQIMPGPGPSQQSVLRPNQQSMTGPSLQDVPGPSTGDLPSVSSGMPIPERIELPEFSPNVVMMLQNNTGGEIMNAVLKVASVYYQFKYPGMKETSYYQAIGRKLVAKYPCLEHEGPKKWSYFSSKLSSRIRQLRLKENKKTALMTRPPSESPVAKRFHVERPMAGRILSEEEFQARSAELHEQWDGQRCDATMKLLMTDIRPNYTSWRLGKPVTEIVEKVPCLQVGHYILEELYTWIGGSDMEKGCQLIKVNSDRFFSDVAEAIPNAPKIMDSSLGLLQALENKIAIVKGKGTKSKTLFTILEVDDIDMSEDVLRGKLSVKDKAPLALRVLTTDDVVKMVYVVGEGTVINSRTTNLLEAVIVLLGAYYIFDLNYPAMYGQLLGFLQQHILEEPYTYFKGSNYQQFSNKLKFVSKESQEQS